MLVVRFRYVTEERSELNAVGYRTHHGDTPLTKRVPDIYPNQRFGRRTGAASPSTFRVAMMNELP